MGATQNAAFPGKTYMNQIDTVVSCILCVNFSFVAAFFSPSRSLAKKRHHESCSYLILTEPRQITHRIWYGRLENLISSRFCLATVCVADCKPWLQQRIGCLQLWTKIRGPVHVLIILPMHMHLDTTEVITPWTLSWNRCRLKTAALHLDMMSLASKSSKFLGMLMRREMALRLMVVSNLMTRKQTRKIKMMPITPKCKKMNLLLSTAPKCKKMNLLVSNAPSWMPSDQSQHAKWPVPTI